MCSCVCVCVRMLSVCLCNFLALSLSTFRLVWSCSDARIHWCLSLCVCAVYVCSHGASIIMHGSMYVCSIAYGRMQQCVYAADIVCILDFNRCGCVEVRASVCAMHMDVE